MTARKRPTKDDQDDHDDGSRHPGKIATAFKVDFNITIRIPQVSAVLDYLNGVAASEAVELAVKPYIEQLMLKEMEVEKFTTALAKARKSIDKLKANAAKTAEAEVAEDEAAAALKADLEAQIAALQKRINEETVTPEEQATFDALVAELDEMDGPDDEEPAPEPTPEPAPEPTPPPDVPPTDEPLPVEEVDPNAP